MKTMLMLMAALCVTVGAQERSRYACEDRTIQKDGTDCGNATFVLQMANLDCLHKDDEFWVELYLIDYGEECYAAAVQGIIDWNTEYLEYIDCREYPEGCFPGYEEGCPGGSDEFFLFGTSVGQQNPCVDEDCGPIFSLKFRVIKEPPMLSPVTACVGFDPDHDPGGDWPYHRVVVCGMPPTPAVLTLKPVTVCITR